MKTWPHMDKKKIWISVTRPEEWESKNRELKWKGMEQDERDGMERNRMKCDGMKGME